MTTRFAKLFEFQIQHQFYDDGFSRDVKASPLMECSHLMKRHGLLIKASHSGFQILYKYQEGEQALIQTIEQPLRLSFALEMTNPQFFNFTDLPMMGKLQYHFSNLSIGEPSNEVFLLNKEEEVSKQDAFEFRSPVFEIPVEAVDQAVQVKITNEEGTAVLEQTLENTNKLNVDLRNEPPGKYSIQLDDAAPILFYLSGEIKHNALGLVDIIIDPKNPMFFDSDPLKAPVFALQFKNRATFWRYYIVPNPHFSEHEFNIADKNEEFTFEENKEANSLPDGTKAVCQHSNKAIELKEIRRAHFKLELIGSGGSSGERKTKKTITLPNASTNLIKPEGSKIFSDIYVYL